MNLMGKICGSSSGDQHNGQQIDDHQHPSALDIDPLIFSSSSAPYHHYHHHQQQQPFVSPPPYHTNHHGGRWPRDCVGHELSSLNHEAEEAVLEKEQAMNIYVEKEHMFDKVVTPSDVGKLNRLVIPKQHAERYFPLDTNSTDNKGGLLLNFEDRNGKLWRFRYSYWNSSQSYVMTKGWSRFVKDKKLDAGDIVSFQRGVGVTAKDRLFIDWRRRVIHNSTTTITQTNLSNFPSLFYNNHSLIHHNWKPVVLQSQISARKNPNLMLNDPTNSNSNLRSVYFGPGGGFGAPQRQDDEMILQYRSDQFGLGFDHHPQVLSSENPRVPSARKRTVLRLFGVNMDCSSSSGVFLEDHEEDDSSTTSQLIRSSSSSTIPYLQLRPNYNNVGDDHCHQLCSSNSTTAHDFSITVKPTAASNIMSSLDLKM